MRVLKLFDLYILLFFIIGLRGSALEFFPPILLIIFLFFSFLFQFLGFEELRLNVLSIIVESEN